MTAPVRIESVAWGDRRFAELAEYAGLADADHAIAKMARLWGQCTLENTPNLTNRVVMEVLGPHGVDALIRSRLGELLESGLIRIRGAKGRTEWREKSRVNGKKGGRPKKIHTKPGGYSTDKPQGFEKNNLPLLSVPFRSVPLDLKIPLLDSPKKKRGRPPGIKSSDQTPAELETIATVLAKLGKHTGIAYAGAAEHKRLITAQLRSGLTEMDLRKVVGYCAEHLGWAADPKMQPYLRPETLFGPKTISRYLDAARAWFETLESSHGG